MEEGSVVQYQHHEPAPMRADEVKAQVQAIQQIMHAVMKDGHHYGKIPGAGDRPTLLKPGAEKIMMTFNLSADPIIEDQSFGDIIKYRVRCRILTINGIFKGAGVGECSSEEEKYKWRAAVSKKEWEATPEDHKRLKYKRDGGTIEQVRTNQHDLANTILKMAKKRALIDGILTVTAASDIFTQDLEDAPEGMADAVADTKPPIQEPKKQSEQKPEAKAATPATPANIAEGFLDDVFSKSGTGKNGPWQNFIAVVEGERYSTFDKSIGEALAPMKGQRVSIEWKQEGKFKSILTIKPCAAQASAFPEDCPQDPGKCISSQTDDQGKPYCEDAGMKECPHGK